MKKFNKLLTLFLLGTAITINAAQPPLQNEDSSKPQTQEELRAARLSHFNANVVNNAPQVSAQESNTETRMILYQPPQSIFPTTQATSNETSDSSVTTQEVTQSTSQNQPSQAPELSREERATIITDARTRFGEREDRTRVPGISLNRLQQLSPMCSICQGEFEYHEDPNHLDPDTGYPDQFVILSNYTLQNTQHSNAQYTCTHPYHAACMLTWISQNPSRHPINCPQCQQPAFGPNVIVFRIIPHDADENSLHNLSTEGPLEIDTNGRITFIDIERGRQSFWEINGSLGRLFLNRLAFHFCFNSFVPYMLNPQLEPFLLLMVLHISNIRYPLHGDIERFQGLREALWHITIQRFFNIPMEVMNEINSFIQFLRAIYTLENNRAASRFALMYVEYQFRQTGRFIINAPRRSVTFIRNLPRTLFTTINHQQIQATTPQIVEVVEEEIPTTTTTPTPTPTTTTTTTTTSTPNVTSTSEPAQEQPGIIRRMLQAPGNFARSTGSMIYAIGSAGTSVMQSGLTGVYNAMPTIPHLQIPSLFGQRRNNQIQPSNTQNNTHEANRESQNRNNQ